jgi:holo-[acyl-carrier protein] synthase
MIAGIGVDIVENKRIKLLIKNKKFVERVFSSQEKLISKNMKSKVNFYSKRYAAKEALSKALGTGIGRGINFKDISIKNDNLGKPYYELNSYVKKAIFNTYKVKKFKIFLSLADEKKYSIALSVIQI